MNRPEQGEVVVLDDGAEVLLRPLRPSDRPYLLAGLRAMSAQSRYYRFGTAALPDDDDVDGLLAVDGDRHVAVAALALDADGEPVEGIGVARYLRDPSSPSVAEATVAVVDAWQRRGVGTRLLERLVRAAREHGVRTFRNYVRADNQRALGLLAALGADEQQRQGEVVVVDLPVPTANQRLRESLTGRTFLAAAVDELRFAFRHPVRAADEAVEAASRLKQPGPPPGSDVEPPADLANDDLDAWLDAVE